MEFSVLSSRERREVLLFLRGRGICRHGEVIDKTSISEVQLHHVHIPALKDSGFVDVNGEFMKYNPSDPLEDLLDVTEKHDMI